MIELPGGWTSASISAVADLVRGVTYKKSDASAIHVEGYLPIIRATNINGSLSLDSQMVFIPARYVRPEQRLEVGDVVVATSSGSASVVGKSAHLNQPWEGGFGAFCMVIRPSPELAHGYLAHLVTTPTVRKHWRELAQGTNINNLKSSDLANTVVPLPPVAEQERIVAAIEEQFSRLDAGVAALERARQNIRRMRAAVLEVAVTGRLVGAPESTNGICDGSMSGLPTDWSIVPVGTVAEVSGGITKNPKRIPRNNVLPFLRVANVMRDRLDLSEVHQIEVFAGELERYRLQRGDLLVVEGNGSPDQIGRSALWDGSIDPCVHQNHLIRVRPGNSVLPEYLNIFWNAPSSMANIQAAASSTSGLHTLSTGKVRNIQLALPPLPVQSHIVLEVDRQLSAISTLDHEIEVAQARGRVLRAGILATAFAGSLVSQDPTDEPASVLLERIAVDRMPSNDHRAARGRRPRALREEVTA